MSATAAPPFGTVLVANRGEIALRVARACRDLGIRVAAVHSTADRDSAMARFADRSVQVGPPAPGRSYLHVPNLIEAAHRCGADAIHPGYGFLSEDPDFAEICETEGLTFIGPPPAVMQKVGDKSSARRLMAEAGLPLLPGVVEPVSDAREGALTARRIGYPVILKAVAGGGGRGMAVVEDPQEFEAAFEATSAHARAVFGNPALYLERFLVGARHVEVQVLCDQHGNGIHLGERDCSVQRRHQKLLEESPCGRLDDDTRARLGAAAVHGALAVGFTGAGTMEFLLDASGEFFFMELNARIQVEHPVSELRTGIDLVREQILVAAGAPLTYRQQDVVPRGVAIECRVNAEDPARGFAPTPGELQEFDLPAGPWTRVDTGYRRGDRVPPEYDSLLAKVLVWAPDREQALARMDRALAEFTIRGPGLHTTLALHRALLRHPVFRADAQTVQFLDDHLGDLLAPIPTPEVPVQSERFTVTHLLEMLTGVAGLDESSYTTDPAARLEDIGLDSLAFLAVQTELQARHGFEFPDEIGAHSSLGEMAEYVDTRLSELSAPAAS